MLLNQLNIKKAIIRTIILSLLAIVTPKIAQAAMLRSAVGLDDINASSYRGQFTLNPTSPRNQNPASFRRAVQNFNLFEGSNLYYSTNNLLTLEGIRYVNDRFDLESSIFAKFGRLGFNLLPGPIYEYTFVPQVILPGRTSEISFYVPSNFIYKDLFSVPLSSNADQLFLRSDLSNGLGNILQRAKSSGIDTLFFPTFIGFPVIPPGVPEPDSTPSLVVFGFGLGLMAIKKKLTQKH